MELEPETLRAVLLREAFVKVFPVRIVGLVPSLHSPVFSEYVIGARSCEVAVETREMPLLVKSC